jgi:hypothetical protein
VRTPQNARTFAKRISPAKKKWKFLEKNAQNRWWRALSALSLPVLYYFISFGYSVPFNWYYCIASKMKIPGSHDYSWSMIYVLVAVLIGFYLLIAWILSSDKKERDKLLKKSH